jgi:hypothetical protein
MTDFSDIYDNVPTWNKYLTVDEQNDASKKLAEEYPETVELMDIGKSTMGESILCLKIGEGKYNAFIHGFPNCEEPYGGNHLTYLSQALAENDEIREALDYTWYIVKCSDPDGARRNVNFQKGPLTPLNFAENYYRTPHSITPDGCFPFRYGPLDLNKPTAETKALMSIFDNIKISFISALHMMKWGGISFMVPHECPELYAPLQNAAKRFNVFLRKRPGTMLAPGIMHAQYLQPARNYVRHWAAGNHDLEPINGCDSYEYAQIWNPDSFIIIPECCLWYEPRMLDDRESESTLGEALVYGNEVTNKANNFLLDTWNEGEPHLKTKTPWKQMTYENIEPLVAKYTNVSNPPFKFNPKVHARKATTAEKIGIEGHDDLYRMFNLGGMYKMFEEEVKASGSEKAQELKDRCHAELVTYDKFLHENYEIIQTPIHNLVGMSIGAVLEASQYTKGLVRNP